MNLPAEDLETFDRLLGPELVTLLDELDAIGRVLVTLPVDRDAAAEGHRTELEERRARLGADALKALSLVRHRLEHGAARPRDDRTMPLPFVDLGAY